MKINGDNEIIKSAYVDKAQKQEHNRNSDFKDILKASVERSAQTKPEVRPTTLVNPTAAMRLNPLSAEDKNVAVERVENLLTLLDHYRKQLADPEATLRSIEPVMNTIAKEKDHLSPLLNSLPNEDGLKDILNRTLITASVEIVKYHRGDYIAG